RTLKGYAGLTWKIFKTPNLALALTASVLFVVIALTAALYKDIYRYLGFSEGRLTTSIGMSIDESRAISSLSLDDERTPLIKLSDWIKHLRGIKDPPVTEPTTIESRGRPNFEFQLAGTSVYFDGGRYYKIVTDENQKIVYIKIEVTPRKDTLSWSDLSAQMLATQQMLVVDGWQPEAPTNLGGVIADVALNDTLNAGVPTGYDVGRFNWAKGDQIHIVMSAERIRSSGNSGEPQFRQYIEVTRPQIDILALLNPEDFKPEPKPETEGGRVGAGKGGGEGSLAKPQKAGGGGGGGKQEQLPASTGKLPQASDIQVMPPEVKPPVVKNPSLLTVATIKADPLLFPPDARDLPYGDPRSKSTTPSQGKGTGGGIGDSSGTGVGPGNGAGAGPGNGDNTGGGDSRRGGGGTGGSGT
ncbi:MAG: hypothetical protein ACRD63_13570, partial [Pyrinomonadaceae bacterium]